MEFRFGRRSTGGIVKAGHGGYYVVPGFVPVIEYTDPDTGHGWAVIGWRALWRKARTGKPAVPKGGRDGRHRR
jgi:hypothetical protein